MKFTAVITPGLLKTLGSKDECEATLLEVFRDALWLDIAPDDRGQSIRVECVECCTVDIQLDPNHRGAETVKDILYESLMTFFDPDYDSDIDVEINDEL